MYSHFVTIEEQVELLRRVDNCDDVTAMSGWDLKTNIVPRALAVEDHRVDAGSRDVKVECREVDIVSRGEQLSCCSK